MQQALTVINTVLISLPLWIIGGALLSLAETAKGKRN